MVPCLDAPQIPKTAKVVKTVNPQGDCQDIILYYIIFCLKKMCSLAGKRLTTPSLRSAVQL